MFFWPTSEIACSAAPAASSARPRTSAPVFDAFALMPLRLALQRGAAGTQLLLRRLRGGEVGLELCLAPLQGGEARFQARSVGGGLGLIELVLGGLLGEPDLL